MPTETFMQKTHRPRIIVTQELIDAAMPRDSGHCMIAEAVKAMIPSAHKVSVDIQTIRFSDRKKGERYAYLTPRAAQVALIAFDREELVKPFKFDLRTVAFVTKSRQPGLFSKKTSGKKKNATTLTKRRDGHAGVVRTGGTMPPRIGARREYGLRALKQ